MRRTGKKKKKKGEIQGFARKKKTHRSRKEALARWGERWGIVKVRGVFHKCQGHGGEDRSVARRGDDPPAIWEAAGCVVGPPPTHARVHARRATMFYSWRLETEDQNLFWQKYLIPYLLLLHPPPKRLARREGGGTGGHVGLLKVKLRKRSWERGWGGGGGGRRAL